METAASNENILEVRDLSTHFFTDDGVLPAVRGLSFSIRRGRTLALVGESGCGKSVASYSILRLIQPPGRIVEGSVVLHSKTMGTVDVLSLSEKADAIYQIRGGVVSMIFQEPMTALSPVHTIGDQIMEAILLHQKSTRSKARETAIAMLRKVGMSSPETRIDQYPHEFSGGMRQRAVIAMALVCRPELLIADEPTTALDVTIQAQILDLIRSLQQEIGCAVLLITHDLGVVAQAADDVAVMYMGTIVEQGTVRDIIKRPRHPYTKGLLRSLPSLNSKGRLASIPGVVPSLTAIPEGCPFHPRCEHALDGLCNKGPLPPHLFPVDGHGVSCFRDDEVNA